jgi:hypothetical protein
MASYNDTRQNGILSQRQNDTTSLDYYQHPSKRWNPSTRYSRAHAIYSLGCVLLEIGLWRPLEDVADVSEVDYDKVVTEFQELAARDLDGSVLFSSSHSLHI